MEKLERDNLTFDSVNLIMISDSVKEKKKSKCVLIQRNAWVTKIIGYLGRWNNYSRIDALQNRKCVSYPLYVRSDMQYVKIGQPYIGCLGQICIALASMHNKIQYFPVFVLGENSKLEFSP